VILRTLLSFSVGNLQKNAFDPIISRQLSNICSPRAFDDFTAALLAAEEEGDVGTADCGSGVSGMLKRLLNRTPPSSPPGGARAPPPDSPPDASLAAGGAGEATASEPEPEPATFSYLAEVIATPSPRAAGVHEWGVVDILGFVPPTPTQLAQGRLAFGKPRYYNFPFCLMSILC
jgi:hypothetical protein